ncbi:MAG: aminotransferase class I/II-fold pyridoxal phosphate-dependent enzyme [Candidatus Magasanikbacteria bacterium]|jgi:perosamine synthetase|nr:aminotransferase class I/II-fold pyridoxal phosphate-dependent enzyme [Candidatus Magasanikbacteria bacterium]
MIFTGMGPHVCWRQALRAKFAYSPFFWFRWKKGSYVDKVESALTSRYGAKTVAVDSGRSALLLALQTLSLKKGDEVILQAFTCAVVVNAVRAAGAAVVYVDVDKRYSIDVSALESAISDRTRAIVVQHTFGIPADIPGIKDCVKKHDIAIIEDCAHTYSSTLEGTLLGTLGDLAVLSFGSDKAISCGRGGALVINNSMYQKDIFTRLSELPYLPTGIVSLHLFTILMFWCFKPMYSFGGRYILGALRKLQVLHKFIEQSEKSGELATYAPAKMNNIIAYMLLPELKRADRLAWHRKKIGRIYKDAFEDDLISGAVFCRYPLLVADSVTAITQIKFRGVLLGDWYSTPIGPKDIDAQQMMYVAGSCPQAEFFASHIVNLPTHKKITERKAQRIVSLIKPYIHED